VEALRTWRSRSAAALRRVGLADHTAGSAIPRQTSRLSVAVVPLRISSAWVGRVTVMAVAAVVLMD
jgi:hypothetical protein